MGLTEDYIPKASNASTIVDGYSVATSVDATGSDSKLATEQAIRELVSAYILSSTFNANTILAANSDNTPEALTVAEDRIIGRISGGNIAPLTAAQIKTFLGFDTSVTISGTANLTGTVYLKPDYESHTTDDTLTAAESFSIHDNNGGGTSAVTMTLPTAEGGCTYTFKIVDSGGITLNTDGTSLMNIAGSTATAFSSTVSGNFLTLVADQDGTSATWYDFGGGDGSWS